MVRRERSRRRGRSGVMSVNLSDVETYTPMDEGTHHLKVDSIEEKEGDAGPYWAWKFVSAEKKGAEGSINHNTSFAKQALFNLKSLLQSLEVEIPDDEFDLAIDDMIGLEMMAEVVHEDVETDNGRRTYGRIVDHWPVSAEESKPGKKRKSEPEEENEKPTRRSKKPKDITEEDVSEMSQEELEEVIDAHKLDIDLGDFKTVSKMRVGVIDALKEAGVIEGEEEEEDDRPSRRSSSTSSKRAKKEEEPEEEEEEKPARRRRRR
jgi:hypothetical protein